MTLEERQLLLIDISARLPYGVKMTDGVDMYRLTSPFLYKYIEMELKPYLRPMSSMTKEEENEFNHVFELELAALEEPAVGHTIKSAASNAFVIDFYNRHHFDYRGLIEKGLALEAPKDMYIF